MLTYESEVPIDVSNSIEVSVNTNNVVVAEGTADLEVTVNRQEYSIVGDEIYIPKRFEDAPTWLQNLITQVVDTSITAKLQDLNELSQSLESMIGAMEVAKNTYELSVISSNDIDERINTAVTTLNSSMDATDATILEVAQTRTTPEEAATITIDVISSQLGSTDAGTIGASVSALQTAIADEEEARSTSIETLTSSIEGAFDVNATALNYINTYVGLDEAGASTGTGLSGYLEGTDGQIGTSGSQLLNTVELKAGEIQNKFAYNSNIVLNGVVHNSGFGLATSINSASIPEGDSQFWVSANEFKVVGANQTAEAQGPFTVNTATGDITFRGKVTFNSGQVGTIDEAIAQVVETVSVGDKNINITDNLIPTTSLVADVNNSGYQFVGTPVKSNSVGIGTFAEPQINIGAADEVYGLYVDEMTIPYYYRFAIKGLVDNADISKFKIVTINGSDVATYSTVTIADISEELIATEWYEVDGIINPVGGDTLVASGSIINARGLKIGSINNFALPSGSVKLLLGWYGECIISRMKLAKITADTLTSNYVTRDYVDSGIDNTVSSATTEEIAKNLGYLSYADMANKATLGQTIINGGYLRAGLIEASAITADMIDAYAIAGKYITGGTIRGTQIIGSVIKGSFIDLTTTLALTNWQYFTPSTVPAAYAGNFAHYNNGGITVDSEGYVRLPGQQNFMVPSIVLGGTIWSGNLSNVTVHPGVTINRVWELYSWDSYNVNTLQRSIRQHTQFSSGGNLVFAGSCVCDDFDNSGTDTVNYGSYNLRVLNTDINVWAQASNGNGHTAEVARITFNGSQVAYGDGRYGEQSGSDCASLDFNSNIKGLPINIKVVFNGGASFWVTVTVAISVNSMISNHTINDVFRIDSISHSLNTANTSAVGSATCSYSVNFPAMWVQ